jgi:hypothetical protein
VSSGAGVYHADGGRLGLFDNRPRARRATGANLNCRDAFVCTLDRCTRPSSTSAQSSSAVVGVVGKVTLAATAFRAADSDASSALNTAGGGNDTRDQHCAAIRTASCLVLVNGDDVLNEHACVTDELAAHRLIHSRD